VLIIFGIRISGGWLYAGCNNGRKGLNNIVKVRVFATQLLPCFYIKTSFVLCVYCIDFECFVSILKNIENILDRTLLTLYFEGINAAFYE
jgi:hypothetical protein